MVVTGVVVEVVVVVVGREKEEEVGREEEEVDGMEGKEEEVDAAAFIPLSLAALSFPSPSPSLIDDGRGGPMSAIRQEGRERARYFAAALPTIPLPTTTAS